MLLLDETEAFGDQPHSGPLSSETEAQRGDSAGWQCTPPSTSPSGSTPSQPPSSPSSRQSSQRPSHFLASSKKRSSKPAHMRRNIRKLLREHQLEAVTKAAHQEELERRRRLEHQRNDFPPNYTLDLSQSVSSTVAQQAAICLDTRANSITEEGSKTLVPVARPHKDDVIDLSSGEDDALFDIAGESAEAKDERGRAHINDALNRPDAKGRVLVNVNHPDSDPDLFLSPQLAHAVKPHQIGGIRFLYDNLVESVQRFDSSSGFGCILAHSMGLGKTLQVISFIDVLLKHTQARTVLAIVPVNTLQNWLAEFNLWVPPLEALPPDADPALVTPRCFKVHILNDEHKTTATRAKVVEDWASVGGVLLMGYEMYRLLSMKKSFVAGRKRKSKKQAGTVVVDLDEEDRQQELLKGIERALSRPGPDVVICDEGHRIKNCHASTSQALKSIRTRRRVVLTGYPLQNNLVEYWCMVDFVRPDFLGTRQEFSNMFERPILNGQCVDSTPQDLRLMRYRSHVLHSLLEGFVQRRGHDVLRDQLPSKEEHVILVRLSPLQRALYTEFMNRFQEAGNSGWLSLNPLKAFCVCCKIWNHPDILYETLQKESLANEQDLDLDDITSAGPARSLPPNQKGKLLETENPNAIGGLSLTALQERANQVITYEWAKDIMCDYKTGVLENSAKMLLLFHLIEESVRVGDKILVFSQSLSTLTVIEEFLAKRPVPASPGQDRCQNQNWIRNHNYYRLDGSTSASERERLINQFNDPSNTSSWVFLLSTRAGCLGVNLIGANRVVVFDASWNPCHDAQAVCRVYRYGQRKPCHIYRLVCDFTLEKKIYDRQISKQGMSDRVVDDLNPVLTFTRREVESLLHFVEEEPEAWQVQLRTQDDMETVIRKACHLYPHLITKQPFHHESLLMDRRELKLSQAEKKAAQKSYEDEKRASVPYTRPSYAHYYPASDQSLTNIPAFSQRNWRPPPRPEEKPVASVRPVQSTTVPMVPRQAAQGSASSPSSDSNSGFPVNYLQKAGVFVQKIVTTTDIVIPGTQSSTDVRARISAGESIHVIRGTKGTYIRTSDGRIFAIRAATKPKTGEENSAATPKDAQIASEEVSTNGSSGSVSPDMAPLSSDGVTRLLSPDSPGILSELRSYSSDASPAGGTEGHESQPAAVTGGHQERRPESTKNYNVSTNSDLATTDSNPVPPGNLATTNEKPQGDAVASTPVRPDADVAIALDLRGPKRKASTPSSDERANKQPALGKGSSAPPPPSGFPFSGSCGLPPMGLSPAMLGGMGHPLYMGAGSPYFRPPSQLGDPHHLFPMTPPDPFSLRGGALPSSSSRSSSSTTTSSAGSSSSSTSSSSSATTARSGSDALPPFMLGAAGVTGRVGMLSSGYPLPYSQVLGGLYPASLLPGGLPAAIPGPAGASFLSHYTPSSSSSSSPSPSHSSGLIRPDGHGSTENGGDCSSSSSGDEDDEDNDDVDDDIIEVMG